MPLPSLNVSVIIFAMLATAWLVYYSRIVLPREFEEKCRQSMATFSAAIEKRSPLHKGIAKRVSRISRAIGSHRGLPTVALIELELAAHLRGIGLCGLPYEMLNMDNPNKWTASQIRAYKKHPELSAGMVRLIPALQHLGDVISMDANKLPLVTLESREILDLTHEYIWTERWEGTKKAREVLNLRLSELRDPQIGRDLLDALQHSSREASRV